jgi:cyclohexa-1,5-dienecarbonyl-CoA hydratase
VDSPGFSTTTEAAAFVVTLDRPPVNVLDVTLVRGLYDAIEPLRERNDVRALVLRSAIGGTFSAGVDVAAHEPRHVGEMLDVVHRLFRLVDVLPQPAIAVVDGRCLGGAAELVALCDFAFATERSTFAFPEIEVGCFPPLATALLPRLVGRAAAELVLTGATIGAHEAAGIGLISRATRDPEAEARRVVERLAARSGAVVAIARKALRECGRADLEEGLAHAERLYREELTETEDASEGVRAFLEKRPPRWSHR